MKGWILLGCLAANPLPVLAQDDPIQAWDDPLELSETQRIDEATLLDRMSRLYRQEATILEAVAGSDAETQEQLLDQAMQELAGLVQFDGTTDDPRFRELYRTIVTEYELYYGVPDTLELPTGAIFDVHEEMFGQLNQGPLLEHISLPELAPMKTTIPMDMNRLVEQSITYLLKHPEKTVDLWRPRADTYFPMIEQILREEGVPDEMKYLAMIESGLNPQARSWARANGMWQFISATGRVYGLETNQWMDERLDPEKATRAAARHLKDLYQMFGGDWHLAMAGYNCSPGRIKRAIRRAESETGRKATFWDIYRYIPRETRNYVPMFIATALVISHPESFNLRPVDRGPRYEYEIVGVEKVIDLGKVAQMTGTDISAIRALNPEIRTGSTPSTKGPYPLRVPLGTGNQFLAAYQTWQQNQPTVDVTHTVRSGDTLMKIARRYGVSVSALREANGLSSNTIHAGQVLAVSFSDYAGEGEPNLASSTPVRVTYGGASIRPVAITALKGPSTQSEGTIEKVAEHTQAAAAADAKRPAASAPASGNSGDRIRYQVRRGDSLGKIAQRHGVSIADLRRWNNIRGSRIIIGQRLTIYTTVSTGSSSASATRYRVRKGDSLYTIARRHGVSIAQLKRWNGLRSNVIRPGQRLKVSG